MKQTYLSVTLIFLYFSTFEIAVTNLTEISPLSKDLVVHDLPLPVSIREGVYSICFSVNEPGRFLLASLDGTILSVDCKSGKQWSLQMGSALSYSEQIVSELDNIGCFLFSGDDWKLYEYCKDGGLRILNLTIEEYVHSTPKIRGSEVTIGSKTATLYLLDADNGEELHRDQIPSNSPAVSAQMSENKLFPSKLEMRRSVRNYIIMVRTDYYINSSVLGKSQWNMMESRIRATYICNEAPMKADDDLNLMPPSQKDIPVYFFGKVNDTVTTGSGFPMLLSTSDFYNQFSLNAKNILKESSSMPQIPYENTDDDRILQNSLDFHSSDSYKDASLQPPINYLPNDPFNNALRRSNNSFISTNNSKLNKNLRVQWSLKSMNFKGFHVALPLFILFVFVLAKCCWEKIDLIKHDKKIDTRGRSSVCPKKKKTRKASNMKGSSGETNHSSIVSTGKHDMNLMHLLRGANNGDGRWVGKLFVSSTEIGRGSNGTVVFEGIHEGRAVAVKRLLRAHNDVAFKEIQNLIASDRHPNIVRWYGVEQDLDFVYISLERCIFSLSDLIQLETGCIFPTKGDDYMISSVTYKHEIILPNINDIGIDIKLRRSNGLPSPLLLKLLRDVVSGVAHLHELGIIHRDLKPQNILVSDGKILTAKVSDMGISKRLLDGMSSLSHHASGHGSSGWRAPEQLHHGRQTHSVDLFSLGCILFYCITKGEHPFGKYYERDANIMNNRLDLFLVDHMPEVVDILLKLLSSEPKMRPNAVEVLHHPLFWSSETRLAFFRDFSDRIELEDRENASELLRALESVGPAAFGGKWGEKLHAFFINDMGRYRKYHFDSMRDLLRVIRNKLNHYRELPIEVKEILGPVPEGFDQYFSTRFPKLLIEVYKITYIYCKEEDSFRKYFNSSLI